LPPVVWAISAIVTGSGGTGIVSWNPPKFPVTVPSGVPSEIV
jgi:hypothetical protein